MADGSHMEACGIYDLTVLCCSSVFWT